MKTIKKWNRRLSSMFFLSASMLSISATEKPNILFILVDDLGWQDVGFMGSSYFETPHLDALSKESLVVTQAYMYPCSSPSRAALATGLHSFRTQIYRVPMLEGKANPEEDIFSRWTVKKEFTNYAEPLQKAGYHSIHLGKWHLVGPYPLMEEMLPYPYKKHLSQPNDDGTHKKWFKQHLMPEVQKYYPQGCGYEENVGGCWAGHYGSCGGTYWAPFLNPFIKDKPTDKWLTDRLTDDAITFMKRHKAGPFFINMHYYTVHRPSMINNERVAEKYRKKKTCPITGQGPKAVKEIIAYATMVENMDYNVGRLINYLHQSGLDKNTLVIFTSDNGFHSSQSCTKNLRGHKGTQYQGGLLVPSLFYWKGHITPRRTHTATYCIDYFPTFMDLAGIDYKGTLDGFSMLPLLQGKENYREEPLFMQLSSINRCTVEIKGDYKMIQYLIHPEQSELFNLRRDPTESHNLYQEEKGKVNEMIQEITFWRMKNKILLPPASPLLY